MVQVRHRKHRTNGRKPSPEPTTGRKVKDGDFEILDGWNVVEVIWQGDRAAHLVNGRIVNVVSNLQQPDPGNPGKFIPLTRGKIAIEIEFAEIWYRRIEVKVPWFDSVTQRGFGSLSTNKGELAQ